jgi:hypothetical protein
MLPQNALVTVTIPKELASMAGIHLDDNEDYIFQFTTSYNPLLSSINIIRGEIGAFISDVPDDTINLLIFENSRLLNEILGTSYTALDAPYQARQYVKCKTEYDLLMGKLLKHIEVAGRGQGDTKRLGDLSISRTLGGTGNDIAKALDKPLEDAKDCYEFYLKQMGDAGDGIKVAIKGETALVGVRPGDIRSRRNWLMVNPSNSRKGQNLRNDRWSTRRSFI